MSVTRDRLAAFAPQAHADIVAALVAGDALLAQASITAPLRLPHFMAQIAHETGGFTIYTENLNYSAIRLTQVWPSHFPTFDAATPYAHNPEALANFIYADANRSAPYRLGNTQPGDGWRYRGRGLIQTTGRDGYRRVSHELDPDALNDPAVGLVAAIDEFVRTGCLQLADADDLVSVRRRINGGIIGLDDSREWLSKAKLIFTGEVAPAPVTPAVPYEDAVKEVQRGLRDMGLYDGEIDGDPGPKTKAATDLFRAKL